MKVTLKTTKSRPNADEVYSHLYKVGLNPTFKQLIKTEWAFIRFKMFGWMIKPILHGLRGLTGGPIMEITFDGQKKKDVAEDWIYTKIAINLPSVEAHHNFDISEVAGIVASHTKDFHIDLPTPKVIRDSWTRFYEGDLYRDKPVNE